MKVVLLFSLFIATTTACWLWCYNPMRTRSHEYYPCFKDKKPKFRELQFLAQIQLMSGRCWNEIPFQLILCYLLNSKLQTLTGARGVRLCLRSYTAILIFQGPVVTDDYIDVAIKEIQVFNQDCIPFKYDVISQIYVTNVFHK